MAKPAPDPACRRYFSRGYWLSGASPEEREAARWVCTTACTVLPECREWALGLPGTILGIIGGLSQASASGSGGSSASARQRGWSEYATARPQG